MQKIKKLLGVLILAAFSCGTAYAANNLVDQLWYIGILRQEPLVMAKFPDQKPSLQLNSTNNTFASFVGCNQLTGTYALTPPNGLQLTLNDPDPNAPCQQEFIDLEKSFMTALPLIKVWEIDNNVMYLKTTPDDVLAMMILTSVQPL